MNIINLKQYYPFCKEELAEYEELIRRLYEAISSLPPMQARRVHTHTGKIRALQESAALFSFLQANGIQSMQ